MSPSGEDPAPSAASPVILGVDTAMRITGYAVIRVDSPSRCTCLDCGVIRNRASLLHSECLRRLYGGICELIEAYHPNCASLESAFVERNIRTAMILSLARGAVIAALSVHGVPAWEYSPKTAKRAAVGTGEASKEQVAAMMAALCSLDIRDIPNDSTDALALAVCHAHMMLAPGILASTQGKKI